MQEVSRLDANNTNQVKTIFMSFLSHELRSPLHGILGSVQLMRCTLLDNFQSSMLNSISVCGRTLLETVQHLLDHAERKETGVNFSTTTFPDEHTICITAEVPITPTIHSSSTIVPFCNIGLTMEEVVESMFLGHGRFDISIGGDDPGAPAGLQQASGNSIAHRRSRFTIIDIADHVRNTYFSLIARDIDLYISRLNSTSKSRPAQLGAWL
jgi:hypothetical protein